MYNSPRKSEVKLKYQQYVWVIYRSGSAAWHGVEGKSAYILDVKMLALREHFTTSRIVTRASQATVSSLTAPLAASCTWYAS